MENYIPWFVLLSTVMGGFCVVLLICWLLGRAPLTTFAKIALGFMFAGAIIPVAILPIWFWINAHGSPSATGGIQHVAVMLWPSSFVVLALDASEPAPWSTILFVYLFAILGNVGAYGTVGLIVGWVYVRFNRSHNIGGG